MNETAVENWSVVPGNPWMIPLEPKMLLPGGLVRPRLYRNAVTPINYDRSYVVAKLAYTLKAFRGLKKIHWDDLMDDVAKEIGISEDGE